MVTLASVGVIPRDVGAVAADAVAGIREPLRVVAGLRAVLGDGVAGQLGPVGPSFAMQSIMGIVIIGWAPAGLRRRDEVVAALAGRAAGFADALEVPVLARLSALICQL